MSTGKPTTPLSSPKVTDKNSIRPSTPPPSSSGDNSLHRISASYLKTPEPTLEVPFSPSLKRTNSGSYKLPDYKLNHNNVTSPYSSANLLKTPRHTGYDSAERRLKLQKTPQYFSPAKKLFQNEDGSPNKEDLTEITLQLKTRLSSALGKLQRDDSSASRNHITFTELSFDSETSPTKKLKPESDKKVWSPSNSLQRANLNLQTLQQSPLPKNTTSPHLVQPSSFVSSNSNSPLKQSPFLHNDLENRPYLNMPSPDEESSAHNALLAALSRQRRKSRSSFSLGTKRRSSIVTANDEGSTLILQQQQPTTPSQQQSVKLPPLNIALGSDIRGEPYGSGLPSFEAKETRKTNEQDAVLSLMSLSSPQSIKFGHSRNHSLNNNNTTTSVSSPGSSRSSLVIVQSPQNPLPLPMPILPPITSLVNEQKKKKRVPTGQNIGNAIDSDATDIDEDVTDDEI